MVSRYIRNKIQRESEDQLQLERDLLRDKVGDKNLIVLNIEAFNDILKKVR